MLHQPSSKHHFAINDDVRTYPFLVSSSRKKTLQHVWLKVVHGGVILKLGKHEYYLEPNSSFWLPANCLVAATYLPNTTVQQVTFSQRLTSPFAKHAGVVNNSAIANGIFERLANNESLDNCYLQVLALEASELKPSIDSFTKQIPTMMPQGLLAQTTLPESQVVTLKRACAIRNAKKSALSGSSFQQEFERIKAVLGQEAEQVWDDFTGEHISR
jgi:hypothetical protein